MSYQITLTNGYVLTTIPDNAIDTTTSLTLVGHLYPGYGTIIGNNFVRLLESGASQIAPARPLTGQLWYDSVHHLMMVWNGTTWFSVTAVTSVVGSSGDITLAKLVAAGVAPLASPVLTGVPTAPTANVGTSNNQIATTAYVVNQVGQLIAGVASVATLTGNITISQLVGKGLAPLDSPAFINVPTAPTAAVATATTQLATTAFVANKLQSFVGTLSGNGLVWDAAVAVGDAVYYNTATKTYKPASATLDTQAPLGLRGSNNQLVGDGVPYVAGGAIYTVGAHYYVDPANPGKLVTVANNAHIGFATDTSTLLVSVPPCPNLSIATSATIFGAAGDATLTMARTDQGPDARIYRLRASNIGSQPTLALSLVNDLGTTVNDVLRFARAGASSVTVDFFTPSLRVFSGSVSIGQTSGNQSVLNFIDNAATKTGSITVANNSMVFATNASGASPMSLSSIGNVAVSGDLAVAGKVTATTAALGTNTTQLATTAFVGSATRIKCSANITFYISPTGSNSTGQVNNVSFPFATMQYCHDLVRNSYDGAGYICNFVLLPGAHTSGLNMVNTLVGFPYGISISSQSGNYADTSVSVNNQNVFSVIWGAVLTLSGLTAIAATGSNDLSQQSGNCLSVGNGSTVTIGAGMNFGAAGGCHMLAQGSGTIGCISAYTISGSAASGHLVAGECSAITFNGLATSINGVQCTLLNSPTFTGGSGLGFGFIGSVNQSYVQYLGYNFVNAGTVVGRRYTASINSSIGVNGKGETYLPGTIAGSVGPGGYYG